MKDRFPGAKANSGHSENYEGVGYDDGNFISHFSYTLVPDARDCSQER